MGNNDWGYAAALLIGLAGLALLSKDKPRCSNCGAFVRDDLSRCKNCGARL